MPFIATLDREVGIYQQLSVAIDNVDRERDRLVIRFQLNDEAENLVFALVCDERGDDLLRLDPAVSDVEAVETILDSMCDDFGLDQRPEYVTMYMLAGTTSSGRALSLTLPPVIEVIFGMHSYMCELELEDDEVVSAETRTLDGSDIS